MKIKPRLFVLLSCVAIGQLLAADSEVAHAQEKQIVFEEIEQKNENSLGVLGYYFYDTNFSIPALINLDSFSDGKLSLPLEKVDTENLNNNRIQSARWVGKIQIDESSDYKISSSDDKNTVVKIGDQLVVDSGNLKTINLEKGLYPIEIEYSSSAVNSSIFSLKLSVQNIRDKNKSTIDTHLVRPEVDPENSTKEFLPKKGLFRSSARSSVSLDTDDDGIFDDWEINGYTVINRVVKPWEDSYAEKGYKKYVSNPNNAHTARDPYTDLEKVSGDVDEGMKWEARDPLVAAVPAISVGMEKIILSRNISESNEESDSETRETGSSSIWSNTEGIEVESTISWLPSMSVTGNYSHTDTQSVEDKNTSGKTWGSSINLNKGETANLNANIRYYNTGTGVVYGLKPTVNFVLENTTLATITAQINQTTSALAPDESYPERRLNGIALNTIDEFSSRLIPLNYEQVQQLDNGSRLRLETTQFSGDFVKRSASGGNIIGGSWDLYIPQIYKTTAGITLDIGDNEAIERRIASRNLNDANDLTPELTLKEAIKKGFGATEKNGEFTYYHDREDKKIKLNEKDCYFILDEKTAKEIERQMNSSNLKSIYSVIIRPGMNIQLVTKNYLNNIEQEVKNLFTNSSASQLNSDVQERNLNNLKEKVEFMYNSTFMENSPIQSLLDQAYDLYVTDQKIIDAHTASGWEITFEEFGKPYNALVFNSIPKQVEEKILNYKLIIKDPTNSNKELIYENYKLMDSQQGKNKKKLLLGTSNWGPGVQLDVIAVRKNKSEVKVFSGKIGDYTDMEVEIGPRN